MCGISGIINKNTSQVDSKKIKKINNLIFHRGPDDEGFFFEKNFAFGHRRLAILDLSSDGHQPMNYLADKYTITYNGEVYNYLEIRKELEGCGYVFYSNTDTEVILASYDKWGESCIEKFNGMWAFAIYNRDKNIIFCSRDRFGIKPFYYTEIEDKFVFGSEIKQLLEFYETKFVNSDILSDYLLYGLEEHTNETFFKNIYKLEQSHNLIYDLATNKFKIYKYFDLKCNKYFDTLGEKESVQELSRIFNKAVELRLRSDVKVGTCLSGGLDSSSIAAIASKKYFESSGEKFIAIHAKSIEEKTDESNFADEVAEYCNLNMLKVEPALEDFSNIVKEVVYTQEEPFGGPSIFMQYFVMKKARESGCIVMLDGQGGDETLFGYETYYEVYFASLFYKFKFIKFFKEFQKLKLFQTSKKQIIKSTISVLMGSKMRYLKYLLGMNPLSLKIKYNHKRLNHLYDFLKFKDFQKRELMQRNLPHLLRCEDKNSMRNSVETRLPFIDYQFVQCAISMNDDLKFKHGYLKYLLRKVVRNILPKRIVWRTNKFGFEAPTDMWIAQHKDKMIDQIEKSSLVKYMVELNHESFNNNNILWKLYNVAIWEEVYEMKIDN